MCWRKIFWHLEIFLSHLFAVSAEIRRTDAGSGASCKRKLQWALCDDGGESRAFSKEMLAFCEEKQFPVICMREDISYAEVLGVINQCILEEQTNVLNQLKLDKILASRTLPQERMKILLALIRGSGVRTGCLYPG